MFINNSLLMFINNSLLFPLKYSLKLTLFFSIFFFLNAEDYCIVYLATVLVNLHKGLSAFFYKTVVEIFDGE